MAKSITKKSHPRTHKAVTAGLKNPPTDIALPEDKDISNADDTEAFLDALFAGMNEDTGDGAKEDENATAD